MAQRTIAQARSLLEDNATALNPHVWKEYSDELASVEGEVRSRAEEYLATIYERSTATGTATGQSLCSVRDDARTLTADLRAGRCTAAEGAKRWNALRAEARRLQAINDRLAAEAEQMATIEQDVVAWYDTTIHAKYPQLRPTFTF